MAETLFAIRLEIDILTPLNAPQPVKMPRNAHVVGIKEEDPYATVTDEYAVHILCLGDIHLPWIDREFIVRQQKHGMYGPVPEETYIGAVGNRQELASHFFLVEGSNIDELAEELSQLDALTEQLVNSDSRGPNGPKPFASVWWMENERGERIIVHIVRPTPAEKHNTVTVDNPWTVDDQICRVLNRRQRVSTLLKQGFIFKEQINDGQHP